MTYCLFANCSYINTLRKHYINLPDMLHAITLQQLNCVSGLLCTCQCTEHLKRCDYTFYMCSGKCKLMREGYWILTWAWFMDVACFSLHSLTYKVFKVMFSVVCIIYFHENRYSYFSYTHTHTHIHTHTHTAIVSNFNAELQTWTHL